MNNTHKVIRALRAYKRLTNYERLKKIISRLKSVEIETVKKYLLAFDCSYGKKPIQTEKLITFVINRPNATDQECCNYLKIAKQNTFEKLVQRAIDKIGYCLASEINTQRKEAYSNRYQAIFEVRHKINLCEIYFGKELPEEAYNILTKGIQLAKSYEIYPELIELLYLKTNFLKLREGTNVLSDSWDEITYYEGCRKAYHKAKHWFNEHLSYTDFSGYRSGYTEVFDKALKDIEADLQITQSSSVAYFYYLIKIEYLHEIEEYELARQYAEKLLNLVKNSKAIYMPWRMGTSYLNLANNNIYKMEFENSLQQSCLAKQYYTPNGFNYSLVEELEFYALFYSGRYEDAEKKIKNINQKEDYKQSPFIQNKREYLHACVLFALGKYDKAYQILEGVTEIHNDKRGWNIGIRILSMLTAHCYGEVEIAFHKAEAFRKYISDMRNRQDTRKRDVLIVKIINEWIKNHKNFSLIFKKLKADFDLLESNHPDYKWHIKSHEMIVFHEWFKCMANRKPYNNNGLLNQKLYEENVVLEKELI